jgi:hypothetical protein
MFYKAALIPIALVVLGYLPTASRADEAQDKLMKIVDIDKSIEEPLKRVLAYLSDRFDLKIEVDTTAFVAEQGKDPSGLRIWLPKAPGVTLDTVFRLTLPQIQAVYEIREKTIVIVPITNQNKRRQFPPYSDQQVKAAEKLKEKVSNLKMIELDPSIDAPVKDVLEFLSDRYDLTIIVDPTELKDAVEEKVHIEKGEYKLSELLKVVLKGIKATYRIEPDHIRIVRQRES